MSPIHYVGTDKLPAVRAGAALNKSKLTTPPWPYLKYSFPTSPSPASIKLHLLRIPAPPPSTFQGLCELWICYSPGCFRKYVLHTGLTSGGDSRRVTSLGQRGSRSERVSKSPQKKSPLVQVARRLLPFTRRVANRHAVL